MENTQHSDKHQRISQLEQSKLIIDSKITHLNSLKAATVAEIAKLQHEISPSTAVPYTRPEAEDICASMLARMKQEVETTYFPIWITFEYYAELHGLESPAIIDDWIERGLVPSSDLLSVGIRLIRDKTYID
ncbi:hypothetical protein [Spirosoma panaciterrae]|uniref:hypothetical protein n=1 Tax=Spirosoma panaciterrae TaxID=496058 RepID=UPI00037B6BF3|nr:hypothetical protein [Spirosoma panaciterrae]